jgi:hypothetical protein
MVTHGTFVVAVHAQPAGLATLAVDCVPPAGDEKNGGCSV